MDREIHTSKLGRDLTVKIPPAFAAELGMEPDSSVDVSLLGNSIIICPARRPRVSLDDLLSGVTDENIHGEVDAGPPVGNEVF